MSEERQSISSDVSNTVVAAADEKVVKIPNWWTPHFIPQNEPKISVTITAANAADARHHEFNAQLDLLFDQIAALRAVVQMIDARLTNVEEDRRK